MHGSSLKKSSSTKGVNKGGGAIAPSPNFRKLLTPLSTTPPFLLLIFFLPLLKNAKTNHNPHV